MAEVLSWERFADGLLEVVAGLEQRMYLIVSWGVDGRVYVQFRQRAESLDAEAVADEFLPGGRQLGFEGADRMRGLGWIAPDVDPGGWNNWRRVLEWPAVTAQYRDLVGSCVAVLRDVHGISSPDELMYKAWRDGERPPVGVTYDPDELEAPVAHVDLPGLGIAAVVASPRR